MFDVSMRCIRGDIRLSVRDTSTSSCLVRTPPKLIVPGLGSSHGLVGLEDYSQADRHAGIAVQHKFIQFESGGSPRLTKSVSLTVFGLIVLGTKSAS